MNSALKVQNDSKTSSKYDQNNFIIKDPDF